MEILGKVSLISGNKAIVSVDEENLKNLDNGKILEDNGKSSNFIVKNKLQAKENEEVTLKISERYTEAHKYFCYFLPLAFFILGYAIGFVFTSDFAHFSFMIGAYGLGLIFTLIIKNKFEQGDYKVEMDSIKTRIVEEKVTEQPKEEKVVEETKQDALEENKEDIVENKTETEVEQPKVEQTEVEEPKEEPEKVEPVKEEKTVENPTDK